jgi:hypothetical protein
MSKTFIITLPDGKSAQRKSEHRTYSHAVIGRHSHATDRDRAEGNSAYNADIEAFRYYMSIADGTHEHAKSEFLVNSNRKNCETVAQFGTPQAYADHHRAERIAEVEAKKAAGYYDAWHALTWCGSLALAQKQLRGWAWFTDRQIVAVSEKQPKQK